MALADELNDLLEQETIADDLMALLDDIEEEQRAKVYLTSSGNSVICTSEYNYRYPFQDGVLTFAKNSVYYILEDETDYVTFRSASDTEVLFTADMSRLYVEGELATIENLEILFGLTGSGSGSTDLCEVHWIGSDNQYHELEDIKECVIYLITDEDEPTPPDPPHPSKEYRVIDGDEYCDGVDKYKYQLHQEREGDNPWVTTATTSVLVEKDCEECGYVPPTPPQPTGDCSVIHYTSSNGKVVTPYYPLYFVADILSNTYSDGVGTITFDKCPRSYGDYVFRYCSELTSIDIPESVTFIGRDAFHDCSGLTSIEIPDSVTTIAYEAFMNCSSLTSVTIGNSVESIGQNAFQGCSSLTSINIPDSVTVMGEHVFAKCTSLTSATFGNSVNKIGRGTFSGCTNLASVDLGNSLTSITISTCDGCSNLTNVVIPNTVTSIERYAFQYCRSLESITYNGTIAQWNDIKKYSDWKKGVPTSCKVHCTDGEIPI